MRKRSRNVPFIAAMAAAGLTGKELARRAGISRVSASLILNRRVPPRPRTMRGIEKALQVSPGTISPENVEAAGGAQ